MTLIDPLPKGYLPQSIHSREALRQNTRILATVLRVSGDQLLLSYQGDQFVARLASSNEADQLMNNQVSQFVIKEFGEGQVVVQLADLPEGAETVGAAPADRIPEMLEQLGLPVNQENITILRGLLHAGYPVSASAVEEFKVVLALVPGWSEAEVQLAAALQRSGLPVTAEGLQIAAGYGVDLPQTLVALRKLLVAYSQTRFSKGLPESTQAALGEVDSFFLFLENDAEKIANHLQEVLKNLGKPLEKQLADSLTVHGEEQPTGEPQALLHLAQLFHGAEKALPEDLHAALEEFFQGAKLQQLINSPQLQSGLENEWLEFQIPVVFPKAGSSPEVASANLRIAYREGERGGQIDQANTCLVFQFDFDNDEGLVIDLSIVDRQIGVSMRASNHRLAGLAEAHLPDLRAGMESSGYTVKTVRCHVEKIHPVQGVRFAKDRETQLWGIDRTF